MNQDFVVAKTTKLILSLFQTKALKKIREDLVEATSNEVIIFWSKIKPIFLQNIEDENLIKLIETKPENTKTLRKLESSLYDVMDKNEHFSEVMKNALSEYESTTSNKIEITQTHSGTGDNVISNNKF